MRVDVSRLWVLSLELGLRSMRAVCPDSIPEGLIPVYDEDGMVGPVLLTEGRNHKRRLF
ncbi:hypothetical protein BDW66DRAFT_130747 [Aspergillus desertorum]